MIYLFVADTCGCDFDKMCYKPLSKNRQLYIESIKDKNRKSHSAASWALLEYAFSTLFNQKIDKAHAKNNGKWVIDSFDGSFSIAHSKNLVAVAVSTTSNIGLDVELISNKIMPLKKRYEIPQCEKDEIDYLVSKFTAEESNYKCEKKANYYYSFELKDGFNEKYKLCVASENQAKINLKQENLVFFVKN